MTSGTGWPEGYDRIVLPEVDSTNAEGLRRASGLAGPTWILALRQSQGRGRRGRAWSMPEGNLAASLVLRADLPPQQMALRSFVAALAVSDAVAELTGRPEGLSLKWPNDVLLNGGKLAGILLEASGGHAVVGIGVNLVAAPGVEAVEPGALRPVSLFSEAGARPTPEGFLEALARAWARHDTRFRTYGFGPVREAWLTRAARLGAEIRARTGTTETTGTFETVDADGNLVLLTAKGRVAIPAADVFF